MWKTEKSYQETERGQNVLQKEERRERVCSDLVNIDVFRSMAGTVSLCTD